jgi:hypothetical protein
VGADVHGDDLRAAHKKHDAKIGFNLHGVDGSTVFGGEGVDLVRAESRIKRVGLKNLPGASNGFLLRRRQGVKLFPERGDGLELILHKTAGGLSFNTASMSKSRPASASAMPSRNESGIQDLSSVRMNVATLRRSSCGNALNSLMISEAVMA